MRKLALLLTVLIAVISAGCNRDAFKLSQQITAKGQSTEQSQEITYHQRLQDISNSGSIETDNVQNILESLTLEEKIGQLFIAAFRYDSNNKPLQILDLSTRQKIHKCHPGGVILFSQNIKTIPQTQKLIKDMQAISNIPLFIAIDEEGGRISRLNNSEKMHATRLPGNEVLGKTGDPEMAYEVGALLGRELSSLGFNMNFAPVADINTNPENPVIGDRSFGSDPNKVADMVEAMVRGMQEQNVCAVLKHFPGHGDTASDTHTGAVVINHNIERLRTNEFIPFERGISAGADGIMTAHIKAPQITKDELPATLSGKFLKEILRDEMGFERLIITDALEMGAISKYWTSADAAIKAIEAGADMLLIPESLEEAFEALIEAVRQGRITEERLDRSVRRVLSVKNDRGILSGRKSDLDPEQVVGCRQHQDIVRKILEKASGN